MEEFVPRNHFLRKIDAVPDLSFVREAVAECYSRSRGRPSVDPELALTMMLLGHRAAQEQPAPTLEVVSGEPKEPQPARWLEGSWGEVLEPDAPLHERSGRTAVPEGKGKESRLSDRVHDLDRHKSRVILSRKVSEAHSSAERRVCIEMLDEVLAKQDVLGLPNRPEVISLDGGFGTGEMAAARGRLKRPKDASGDPHPLR